MLAGGSGRSDGQHWSGHGRKHHIQGLLLQRSLLALFIKKTYIGRRAYNILVSLVIFLFLWLETVLHQANNTTPSAYNLEQKSFRPTGAKLLTSVSRVQMKSMGKAAVCLCCSACVCLHQHASASFLRHRILRHHWSHTTSLICCLHTWSMHPVDGNHFKRQKKKTIPGDIVRTFATMHRKDFALECKTPQK